MTHTTPLDNAEYRAVVEEFMDCLMDLLRAVQSDSDTYGTWQEEKRLRDFLLASGLLRTARNDGQGASGD